MKVSCTMPQNGVFFAGELFTCLITLTNEGSSSAPSTESTATTVNQPTSTRTRDSNPAKTDEKNENTTNQGSYLGGLLRGFLGSPVSSSLSATTKPNNDSMNGNATNHPKSNYSKSADSKSAEPSLVLESMNGGASIQGTLPITMDSDVGGEQADSVAANKEISSLRDMVDNVNVADEEGGAIADEEGGTINLVAKQSILPHIQTTSKMKSHARSLSNTPTVEAADFDTRSNFDSPDHATPSFQDIHSNFGGDVISTVSSKPPLRMSSAHRLQRLSISALNGASSGKIESIAMGFAQMSGQFTIDSHYIKKDLIAGLRDRVLYRIPGAPGFSSSHPKSNGHVYGGGSLSTTVSHHEKSAKPINDALPLYNTPPTILFCDLRLGVGESKTFKYEMLLPAVLPPSHRGKVIRFHYKLVIGIQDNVMNSATRVVYVPFRFFNRTNPDGSRPVFELLNPVIHSKDQSIVTEILSQQEASISPRPSTSFVKTPQLLMDASNNVSPVEQKRTSQVGDSTLSVRSSATSRLEQDYETMSVDNVMNVLQLSGKVSYDICKNSEHIAKLVLGRLGYRLGESVTAVLNFSKSTVPCFHVSAFLEVQESVESLFSTKPKELVKQHTRICVGEFHQHTINSRRTAIVLNIPAKATPDFQSSAVSNSWSLRFEFITGSESRVLSSMAQVEGYQHQKSVSSVSVESFDCTIPLKVYGALKASKQQKKVLEFRL